MDLLCAFHESPPKNRNHKERLGQTRKKTLTKQERLADIHRKWHEPSFAKANLLMHEGSVANFDCYCREKDATIPTGGGSMPFAKLSCPSNSSIKAERPNLVFFAGKSSAGVRDTIKQVISNSDLSIYHIDHRFSYPDYICAMKQSEFCIAPRGNAAWSPRLEESINNGCIPVIVADMYDPPFVHVLDYDKFSVRIKQDQIKTLPQVLANLTQGDRIALRENGRRVRHLFTYGTGDRDAVPLIAFELWAHTTGVLSKVDMDLQRKRRRAS